MENQCSAERPCAAVQILVQRTNDHDKAISKLETSLEKIQDRLPPWVTFAGTAAGALIGVLGALASK